MSDAWNIGPGIPHEPTADNRRRAGRLACNMLKSSFGDVLDLSITGMRSRSTQPIEAPVGQIVDFDLETVAGTVRLQGKVVWATKKGWRRHEFGIQFVNVTDQLRRTLVEVARISTDRECIKRSA